MVRARTTRWAIAALALVTMSACSPRATVGYRPPFAPVTLSIDVRTGEISLSRNQSIVTPFGTFSLDAGVSHNLAPPDNGVLLIVRHRSGSATIDDAFKVAEQEIAVVVNGKTTISVTRRRVFVDASAGTVTSIKITDTTTPVPHGGQTAAPFADASGVPPTNDPGQIPLPNGAQRLGGVDLDQYCSDGWAMHAVLRYPNTWGWRCSTSSNPDQGNRVGDQSISVDDACAQQYRSGAKSHYGDYLDPNSWFCWISG